MKLSEFREIVNEDNVIRFRKARNLNRVFPERYKLRAKVFNDKLAWCLFEFKDFSLKPVVYDENPKGLSTVGWNKTLNKIHSLNYGGCYEFWFPSHVGS